MQQFCISAGMQPITLSWCLLVVWPCTGQTLQQPCIACCMEPIMPSLEVVWGPAMYGRPQGVTVCSLLAPDLPFEVPAV